MENRKMAHVVNNENRLHQIQVGNTLLHLQPGHNEVDAEVWEQAKRLDGVRRLMNEDAPPQAAAARPFGAAPPTPEQLPPEHRGNAARPATSKILAEVSDEDWQRVPDGDIHRNAALPLGTGQHGTPAAASQNQRTVMGANRDGTTIGVGGVPSPTGSAAEPSDADHRQTRQG